MIQTRMYQIFTYTGSFKVAILRTIEAIVQRATWLDAFALCFAKSAVVSVPFGKTR